MNDVDMVPVVRTALRKLYPHPDSVDLDIAAAIRPRRHTNGYLVPLAACVVAVVVLAIVLTRLSNTHVSRPGDAGATSPNSVTSSAPSAQGYATFGFHDSRGDSFTETINQPPHLSGRVYPADPARGLQGSVRFETTGSTGSVTNTAGRPVALTNPVELYGYWPGSSAVCVAWNVFSEGGRLTTFKKPAGSYCSIQLTYSHYDGIAYTGGQLPDNVTIPAEATKAFSCDCTHEGIAPSGLDEATATAALNEYEAGPSFILAGPVPFQFSQVQPGHHAKEGQCSGDPDYVGGYLWESTPIRC